MPKLFLLRHAQAISSFEKGDKDRVLSDHGITQAKFIAPHIQDIDIALCSSAKRTQMTLSTILENGARVGKTEMRDDLYNAPAGNILAALQECPLKNILIVAHNPGIHQLAGTLASEGNKADLEKLRLFYQPATLSVFDCDVSNWEDIQPQVNKLIDLIIPD